MKEKELLRYKTKKYRVQRKMEIKHKRKSNSYKIQEKAS
jgi:hypothetical protein